MKRFTGHTGPWAGFIGIRQAKRSINAARIAGKNVFMGTVTDRYNPYEAKHGITRSIL